MKITRWKPMKSPQQDLGTRHLADVINANKRQPKVVEASVTEMRPALQLIEKGGSPDAGTSPLLRECVPMRQTFLPARIFLSPVWTPVQFVIQVTKRLHDVELRFRIGVVQRGK
jgi:hypothetical protein